MLIYSWRRSFGTVSNKRNMDKTMEFCEIAWPPRVENIKGVIGELLSGDGYRLPRVKDFVHVIREAKAILEERMNVVNLTIDQSQQLVVIGDLHGQFFDFLQYLAITDHHDASSILLVNGDMVDRGNFSLEILFVLSYMICASPTSVLINRGNHESAQCTKECGFQQECRARYGDTDCSQVITECLKLFHAMPVATIVNNDTFIVHGGPWLDPNLTLADIQLVDRHVDPVDGPFCDMLWADPGALPGITPSNRNFSHHYGADYVEAWLARLGLSRILRSHQVVPLGLATHHDGAVATLYSAPGNTQGDRGAVLRLTVDSAGDLAGEAIMAQHIAGEPDVPKPVSCVAM